MKYERYLESNEGYNELTCPNMDLESVTKKIVTTEFSVRQYIKQYGPGSASCEFDYIRFVIRM